MIDQLATKRHPLLQGENTLDLGLDEDLLALTDEQAANVFLSKYMEVVDPVTRFSGFFQGTAKTVDHVFRDVKLYYRRLVCTGKWNERKYVAVINDMFEQRAVFAAPVLDRFGKMHDNGMLASQRRLSQARRGRKRR